MFFAVVALHRLAARRGLPLRSHALWVLPFVVIVLDVMGVIPYYSRLTSVDFDGLTDASVARLVHTRRSSAAVDYAAVIDYLYGRQPRYLVLPERASVAASQEGAGKVASMICSDARFARYEPAPAQMPGVGLIVHQCRSDVACP